MDLWRRFQCARGHHQRDRKAIWREAQLFHSRCRGCGRPMLRGLDGWTLVEAARAPSTR